jgi:hypothetical protein
MSFTIQCGVSKDAKSKMYKKRTINLEVLNLLDDDNSLPWEKKLGRKVENSEIFGCFKKYRTFQP